MKVMSFEEFQKSEALRERLLPCPYCDATSHELFFVTTIDDPKYYYVACNMCGMDGPTAHGDQDALKAWNFLPRKKHKKHGKNKRTFFCLTCGRFLLRVTDASVDSIMATCDVCKHTSVFIVNMPHRTK